MEQHDIKQIMQLLPVKGNTCSSQGLDECLLQMLDMSIEIYTEADQLQAWILGQPQQPLANLKMNAADNYLARTQRRVGFLKDIHQSVMIDKIREAACSDLFWGNMEYRKSVLRGALHAAVYVRENILHLILRICSQ